MTAKASDVNRCAYPWQQMIIDLTGEVVPCCYWSGYGNSGKPLGNTNVSTIDEIWRGEGYTALRRQLAEGDLKGHPCGNCMAYRGSNGVFPKFSWPAGFVRESGFCCIGQIPEAVMAAFEDIDADVVLLEDGAELPGRNALHDDIRKFGMGRYSVWHGWLYFSSSNNADPTTSGRRYELACGEHRAVLGGFDVASPSGKNLLRAYTEFELGRAEIEAEPSMISLISTADCNIDCPACSQNIVRVTRVQHRPETVPAVLAKVPYLTQFIWHGGEPYLIKRFRDFIDNFETAHNPNLAFGFTSNGTMITAEEVRKLGKFPRVNASVSIDSFNPETFARIRAGASFERVWSNFERLLKQHDAPKHVFSVGMIICKSNFAELADNLEFAVAHDIGINLSPVLLYPVTEQLNVFENFAPETTGWREALANARRIVSDAKAAHRCAIRRVDPEGMIEELTRIYEEARADNADVLEVHCEVIDRYGSLAQMRRPAIIACVAGTARAYALVNQGSGAYLLRLPRRHIDWRKTLRVNTVHDVMEPFGYIDTQAVSVSRGGTQVRIHIPEFAGAPRPRNIKWANYGDATPDGLNVVIPEEIHAAYRRIYRHELGMLPYSRKGGLERGRAFAARLGILMEQRVRYAGRRIRRLVRRIWSKAD
jgi:MoaA/NifB/PqqE/SkfB family radical SAM enzyme